jgi:tRNA-dihydrouridine synthase A
LEIILNGGLRDLDHARNEGAGLDGVMLGRAAYQTPAVLLGVDERVFGSPGPSASREAAVEAHIPYIERQLAAGSPLHSMTRHMLGLFNARPGGRLWRRVLSERGVRAGAGVEVVHAALAEVTQASARAA